ncbi:MAG: hypothetical protein HY301_10345 [Verrucomicrobia bacterium]|nr:hypothetical protein [Verrucomicrobiota bacterium]
MPSSSSSSPSSSSSSGSSAAGGGGGSHNPPANKAVLAELNKAEQLALVAQKVQFAPALAVREITAAKVTALLANVASARTLSGQAVGKTVAKEGATEAEATAKANLLKATDEIQTAAKQKFGRTNPNRLQVYRIGERVGQNRALLEQYALDLITAATADSLPGITAAKLTAATGLRTAYINTNVDQTTAQGDATDTRSDLATLKQQITDARIEIQLAADAEWPHTDAANHAVRKEFKLPTRSKFKG